MLEYAEQNFFKEVLASLLRGLISRSSNSLDLDLIKALLDTDYVAEASSIDAAASLKKIRLLLKVDQHSNETSHVKEHPGTNTLGPTKKGILLKLLIEGLSTTENLERSNRQIGQYRSSKKKRN